MALLSTEFRRTEMAGLGQILYRTFFWSYERGIMAIRRGRDSDPCFRCCSRHRRWFHDQPQVGLPAQFRQVELLSKAGETEVYRVDARVLAPPERTPALQNDLHNALQKAQPEPATMAASPLAESRPSATKKAMSSLTRWKSATSSTCLS